MSMGVVFSEDPNKVLREAGAFLASEPVLHNIILTILHERAAYPEAGRYWIVEDEDAVVGVVLQSPPSFAATLTPMPLDAVEAVVDVIHDAGITLPGVIGDAATAARFAGRWTERYDSAAVPIEGQRIYEVIEVRGRAAVGGSLCRAVGDDRDLILDWMHAFHTDIGQRNKDLSLLVEARLSAGQFWLWDDEGPASLSAASEPAEGVVRVNAAYTPPEKRNCGYAGACVGALSARTRASGYRCILYTDLGNPASNAAFRRVGYRAVAEALRYGFVE